MSVSARRSRPYSISGDITTINCLLTERCQDHLASMIIPLTSVASRLSSSKEKTDVDGSCSRAPILDFFRYDGDYLVGQAGQAACGLAPTGTHSPGLAPSQRPLSARHRSDSTSDHDGVRQAFLAGLVLVSMLATPLTISVMPRLRINSGFAASTPSNKAGRWSRGAQIRRFRVRACCALACKGC